MFSGSERSFGERSYRSSCRRGRSSSPQVNRAFSAFDQPVGDSSTFQVHVDQKYVGYIVGRSGRTIQKIVTELNVKLQFDQSTHEQGYSTLHIEGIPAAVGRAKARIDQVMRDFDEKNAGNGEEQSLRGRSPSITSRGTLNRRSTSRRSDSTSCRGSDYEASVLVRLERNLVGIVIGHQGQTVRRLEKEFDVKIDVKNPRMTEDLSKLYIFGDASSIRLAKARVLEIVQGSSDATYTRRGGLRECASSDSSRAASPASWSDSDGGSRSGTDVGKGGSKGQWRKTWRWAPWAPTKYLRSKLEHLMGRWYCGQHCYEVDLDAQGRLRCTLWSTNEVHQTDAESWKMPRAIYYEGDDIFLGERCRFFLDSLTKTFAIWGDEQRPGVNLRWLRWSASKASQSKAMSCKSYSHFSSSSYSQFSRSKEGFRMTASDFPSLS